MDLMCQVVSFNIQQEQVCCFFPVNVQSGGDRLRVSAFPKMLHYFKLQYENKGIVSFFLIVYTGNKIPVPGH